MWAHCCLPPAPLLFLLSDMLGTSSYFVINLQIILPELKPGHLGNGGEDQQIGLEQRIKKKSIGIPSLPLIRLQCLYNSWINIAI